MLSLLRLECKQKKSSSSFQIRIFFFLSHSSGIETVNTFIHSRSYLENHSRFQTKMGKVYTRFQTKTAQKPYPIGRHIPVWLIQGSTPPHIDKFEDCTFNVSRRSQGWMRTDHWAIESQTGITYIAVALLVTVHKLLFQPQALKFVESWTLNSYFSPVWTGDQWQKKAS